MDASFVCLAFRLNHVSVNFLMVVQVVIDDRIYVLKLQDIKAKRDLLWSHARQKRFNYALQWYASVGNPNNSTPQPLAAAALWHASTVTWRWFLVRVVIYSTGQ